MPGYIKAALFKFNHPTPSRPQHSPHRSNPIQYGAASQKPNPIDTTAQLDAAKTTRIQQITGTLLYYARAVDGTLLVALSAIASSQAKATQQTEKDILQILDYCATHPNGSQQFKASDMILKIHSDASYLNAPKSRSRV